MLSEIGDALFGHHFPNRPQRMSDLVRNEQAYKYGHAVDWASGAVMLISSKCDRIVGAWDETFFLYMEEVDYAARIRDAGYQIMYVPQAQARHLGGGSSQSSRLVGLMAVSRVRYFEKRGRQARVFRVVVCLSHLLRSTKPAHRAALRAVSRRSSWGPLISGLKGTPSIKPDVESIAG